MVASRNTEEVRRTYIILMFSTLIAGRSVKTLIERQATVQVATKVFLFVIKFRPYTVGQKAADTKQMV